MVKFEGMRNKVLLCVLIYFLPGLQNSFSQVRSVSIGINGLHCSACSFGTEKSLRQLDFVREIKMDLNAHVAEVTFKQGKIVDFDALAKKVVDAGYSVRSICIVYDFKNYQVVNNSCLDDPSMILSFVGVKAQQVLNGPHTLQVLGKDFMPAAEFKKWKTLFTDVCKVNGGVKKIIQVSLA